MAYIVARQETRNENPGEIQLARDAMSHCQLGMQKSFSRSTSRCSMVCRGHPILQLSIFLAPPSLQAFFGSRLADGP